MSARQQSPARGRHARIAVGCALVLAPSTALAYSDAEQFTLDPLEAGGGGRFYTGSPADGYGCDSCHAGGASPGVQIDGVPSRYVAGATYELSVRWPRSLEHAAAVLELTDDQGRGAGTLALPPSPEHEDAELCEPASDDLLAAQLFTTARERTVAATPDCGAFQLRVQWTAPSSSAGPVWLAASVLASNHDGDVTGDGVTMFAQPIPAYGDGATSKDSGAGCSVVPAAHDARSSCLWIALALTFLLVRRVARVKHGESAARARVSTRLAALLSVLALLGCGDAPLPEDEYVELSRGQAVRPWEAAGEDADAQAPQAPDAGPSTMDAGVMPSDAGVDASQSDGSQDAGAAEGPTGVVFKVTTLPQGGRYAPKNIGAIWVEDEQGRWVKTLARWAARRMRYLAAFKAANPEGDITDAITSATLRTHETHEVTWDLRGVDGELVPDGRYAILVEVTDRDGTGKTLSVPFVKSNEPGTVRVDDTAQFAAVELVYQ